MQAMSDFLSMGGYGSFVWPAFCATLAILAVLWFTSARALRNSENILQELDAKRPRR